MGFVRETATLLTIGILAVLAALIIGLCIRTAIRLVKAHKRKQAERLAKLKEETLEKERANQQKFLEQVDQRIGAHGVRLAKWEQEATKGAAPPEPQQPLTDEPVTEVGPTTPSSKRSRNRSASTSGQVGDPTTGTGVGTNIPRDRSSSLRESRALEPLMVPAPTLEQWPMLPMMGPTYQPGGSSQFR